MSERETERHFIDANNCTFGLSTVNLHFLLLQQTMKPMVNEIKQQNEISLQVLYKYKSSDYLVQLNIICLEFVSLKVQCIQLKYMYEIFKDF